MKMLSWNFEIAKRRVSSFLFHSILRNFQFHNWQFSRYFSNQIASSRIRQSCLVSKFSFCNKFNYIFRSLEIHNRLLTQYCNDSRISLKRQLVFLRDRPQKNIFFPNHTPPKKILYGFDVLSRTPIRINVETSVWIEWFS